MKYKTTYFLLSINQNITRHSGVYDDWIKQNYLIAEVKQLTEQLENKIEEYANSLRVYKDKKNQGSYFQRSLNPEEQKELILQYQIKDIKEWKESVSLSGVYQSISMKDIVHSKLVTQLKALIQRLDNLKDLNRFTTQDEMSLNNHLNENAVDGWRLHSMNPISKGLFNWAMEERAGAGYGHNVTEGFVLLWEKES